MRVLVTGAAGFVGAHVARRLLAEGCEVRGFDLNRNDDLDCDWRNGDFTDADAIESAIQGCDVVCHVGAIGDVYLAAADPRLACDVNVTGTANVSSAAVKHGARVVYASTWEVYGDPVFQPITEEHPCDPDHPYNITKLAGERILLAASRLDDLSVLSLRLGTAYGSGLRPNSVFRLFIDKARAGEPITIQGDGSQGRQFTHASDIARAFFLACHSDLRGQALNIVADQTVSIKELADEVAARHPTDVVFDDARPGDVAPALVSNARASERLGWRPEMEFGRGLAELMDAT